MKIFFVIVMMGIIVLIGCLKFVEKVEIVTFELIVVVSSGDIIKVGILYLFLGIMVIFEILFKDMVLMIINEINVNGGVLGKKLEFVVVDLVFDWFLFVEKV